MQASQILREGWAATFISIGMSVSLKFWPEPTTRFFSDFGFRLIRRSSNLGFLGARFADCPGEGRTPAIDNAMIQPPHPI